MKTGWLLRIIHLDGVQLLDTAVCKSKPTLMLRCDIEVTKPANLLVPVQPWRGLRKRSLRLL